MPMSIDEAIAHAREVAEKQRKDNENCKYKAEYGCKGCADYYSKPCIECAEEHEQLAEWLEELKFLRQWKSDIMDSFCKYDVNSFEELVTNTRNKVIDDFVKEFKRKTPMENCLIDELAEQLKAGGKNEQS